MKKKNDNDNKKKNDNDNEKKNDNDNKKENEEKEKDPGIYTYLDEFYSENNREYNSKGYINKNHIINETGLYEICVYGAAAIKGGKGGVVCGKYFFKVNNTLQYELGGREAGGVAGINCGISRGKGTNGAGRAYAKFNNEFEIVAGGGGGCSESGNKGGDAEENGDGYYGGGAGTTKEGGRKGDPDYSKIDDEDHKYAKSGKKDKGGKGGQSIVAGKSCGGGGGDGYYGGGGGCFGVKPNDGGGGGGSNYYSNNVETPIEGKNKNSIYSRIKISRIIS